MEIKKGSITTKANVHVNTVIIHFNHFKPVPLNLEESCYFGILKPTIINEIFGTDYIPIYSPTSKPADLKKSIEVPHQHLGFPRVFSWSQTKKSVVTNSGFFLILKNKMKIKNIFFISTIAISSILVQIQVFSSFYRRS